MKTCPVCGGPITASAHRPFCSGTCADRDLARWLNGDYRIAGQDGGQNQEEDESGE